MKKFKIGHLVKWINYCTETPKEHIGLLIRVLPKPERTAEGSTPKSPPSWYDIEVLCEGEYVKWVSWQCEVVNESR